MLTAGGASSAATRIARTPSWAECGTRIDARPWLAPMSLRGTVARTSGSARIYLADHGAECSVAAHCGDSVAGHVVGDAVSDPRRVYITDVETVAFQVRSTVRDDNPPSVYVDHLRVQRQDIVTNGGCASYLGSGVDHGPSK